MAGAGLRRLLWLLHFGLKFLHLFSKQDNYADKTNRALIAECLKRNTVAAWQEFVRRFQPMISGAIGNIVRSHQDHSSGLVEQLTQDTFTKLCEGDCKRLRSVNLADEESLCRYLRVVARNVARDHFRAEDAAKRGRDMYGGDPETAEKTGVAKVERGLSFHESTVLLAEVEHCLRKVTKGPTGERDRLIFWLHYRQGFTAGEIALVPCVKLTDKGVESVLFRLVSSLRRELGRGGQVLSAKG